MSDVRRGSELERRLTNPPINPPAPAKQRAFERAVAGQFVDVVESNIIVGDDEDVCSAVRDSATGDRYVTSQYGMRVRLPENNGQAIAFAPGMRGSRDRAKECAQGVWQGATLVDDSHFLRHVGRLYAARERVQDKVTARDDGIQAGGAEIIRDMAFHGDPGFDAALLVNLHTLNNDRCRWQWNSRARCWAATVCWW